MITQSKVADKLFFQFRQRQYDGMKKHRLGIFHVSDYVPECTRNSYYNHLETDAVKTMDTKTMSIFWAGEAIHQMLDTSAPDGSGETPLAYNFIDDVKVDIFDEKIRKKITEEEWLKIIVGESDSLYKVNIDGKEEWVIVDYKTWLSKGYKKKAASDDHKTQINIYKYLFLKSKGIDVKWGAVIYMDYADRLEKPLIFPFKLDKMEDIEAKLKFKYAEFLHTYKTGELPERVKTWKCDGYCQHAERCFTESKLSIKENKLVVNR